MACSQSGIRLGVRARVRARVRAQAGHTSIHRARADRL